VAPCLHLSTKQREDARKGKFVPLANFLLSQQSKSPLENHSSESNSALRLFTEALETATAEGAASSLARNNSKTPKFREFIDVVNAFAGGLIPIACANRPDRLGDYMSFLFEILIQHSTGKQHWPVLLHYIESIRRARQPSGEGPDMDKIRDTHRLCTYPSPASRYSSVLDMGQLLLSASIFNDPSLRFTLQQDFIDISVLQNICKTTLPEVNRVNKLFSNQAKGPSTSGNANPSSDPSTSKLPHADYIFAKKHNICVKFLNGLCHGACPQNRIHEELSVVRSRSSTKTEPGQEKGKT
jgi:hypothetical protein